MTLEREDSIAARSMAGKKWLPDDPVPQPMPEIRHGNRDRHKYYLANKEQIYADFCSMGLKRMLAKWQMRDSWWSNHKKEIHSSLDGSRILPPVLEDTDEPAPVKETEKIPGRYERESEKPKEKKKSSMTNEQRLYWLRGYRACARDFMEAFGQHISLSLEDK